MVVAGGVRKLNMPPDFGSTGSGALIGAPVGTFAITFASIISSSSSSSSSSAASFAAVALKSASDGLLDIMAFFSAESSSCLYITIFRPSFDFLTGASFFTSFVISAGVGVMKAFAMAGGCVGLFVFAIC